MISSTMNGVTYLWLLLIANQIVPNSAAAAAASLERARRRELPACGDGVSIEASCKVDDDGSDCNKLGKHYWACQQAMSEMTLRYNGGDCNQGYNSQPLQFFTCSDGDTPPTMEEGKRVFILVKDVNEGGTRTYFSQYVIVGEDFLLVDMEVPGRILDVDLNVTIYSSGDDIGPASILQTFVFHTSCLHSLFLNDYYGSTQVVGFNNEKQGMVSNFMSATLNFVVKNEGQSSADISSFKLQTRQDVDFLNEFDNNSAQNLDIGAEMSIMKQVYFDVGVSREFVITATVGTDGESPCEVTQDLKITIGTPEEETSTEDIVEVPADTDAPSAAPITAMPIMENNEEHCNLVSSIFCEVKGGSSSCDSLKAPVQTECQGGIIPKQLTFKYTGQTCAESDHDPDFRHRFVCIDETAGIENTMNVFVAVNDESPHPVPKNEEFSWVSNFGSYIHVTVFKSENNQPGAELQNMKIGTRCVEGDDLSLMKNYGAIQLLAFENESQGSVASYADVELTYMIENNGDGAATELSAVAKCDGQNHELVTGESIQPNQVKEYIQHERVNLVGSPNVRFELDVTATSNGAACAEQNEYFVSVA
jgi:hypothetical protein